TNRWADELITGYALDFIERNKEKPFVAYLSFLTCHSPLDAPDDYIRKYEAKGLSHNLATLYGMIDKADVSLGRFFRKVDSLGISDNTVIMFLSDNGPAIENDKFTDEDRSIRYVNHLKGHKGNIWENGVKSAFFVSWKGHYKAHIVHKLTDITDILPSMMEIAGVSLPGGYLPLDGISFKPFLDSSGQRKEKISYNYANPAWPPTDQPWTPEGVKDEYHPVTQEEKPEIKTGDQIISVRKGDYKLMLNPAHYADTPADENGYVLINISKDPQENNNILDQNQAVFIDLRKDLFNWFESIKASDHSFAMPIFFIADTLSNEIPSKAPVDNSGSLQNTFNSLWGWNDPNDWAKYNIDVLTPGSYQVVFSFQGEVPVGSSFTVETGNHKKTAVLDENGRAGTIELAKGDRMLKISCNTPSDHLYKLMTITLERMGDE
ncbi:MAG TPA: sulfatase-like hydrolase/transferase, partial [Bacteroidales bacterium]|nr:sulfatase-like hydrolase/transferase [Bacteroidales bacterium]